MGIELSRNPDTVLGADLAFVAKSKLPVRRSREGYLETIPDLVIEVRSKNDTRAELERKAQQYLSAGVVIVLISDPEAKTVAEHRVGIEPHILANPKPSPSKSQSRLSPRSRRVLQRKHRLTADDCDSHLRRAEFAGVKQQERTATGGSGATFSLPLASRVSKVLALSSGLAAASTTGSIRPRRPTSAFSISSSVASVGVSTTSSGSEYLGPLHQRTFTFLRMQLPLASKVF